MGLEKYFQAFPVDDFHNLSADKNIFFCVCDKKVVRRFLIAVFISFRVEIFIAGPSACLFGIGSSFSNQKTQRNLSASLKGR